MYLTNKELLLIFVVLSLIGYDVWYFTNDKVDKKDKEKRKKILIIILLTIIVIHIYKYYLLIPIFGETYFVSFIIIYFIYYVFFYTLLYDNI